LHLEVIIFNYFKANLIIKISEVSRVLNHKKLCNIPDDSKVWLNSNLYYFTDLIRCFFFAMHFKNSNILCYAISKHISNKKQHFYYLKGARRLIDYFLKYESIESFLGLRIRVHGKFQGILKKRQFKMYRGYRSLHKLSTKVDYSAQRVYTKFGVFSIKVWLFYRD
jgi:hypothetical protein